MDTPEKSHSRLILNDEYSIVSDGKYNWSIERKKTYSTGKNAGQHYYENMGYHVDLGKALIHYLDICSRMDVHDGSVVTVEEALEKMELIKKSILDCLERLEVIRRP